MKQFIFLISFICSSTSTWAVITEEQASSENPVEARKKQVEMSPEAIENKLRSKREDINAKIMQDYRETKLKQNKKRSASQASKKNSKKDNPATLNQKKLRGFWSIVSLLVGVSIGLGLLFYKIKSIRARIAASKIDTAHPHE